MQPAVLFFGQFILMVALICRRNPCANPTKCNFPDVGFKAVAMIKITPALTIEDSEFEEQFIRSSGPGGQNVNKVSTAVELRFDVLGSAKLAEPVRVRLCRLAGSRLTKDGILVLRADQFRTQEANRKDARERLAALIREALIAPKRRVKTKPTRASKERRVEGKKIRSVVKKGRQGKSWD